jgi:flagellin-like hook-associated protein FlgL
MKKLKLFLTLLTIAITVTPIAVEVILYHDNLSGLIIPKDFNNIINGDNSNSNSNSSNGNNLLNADFQPPQPVGEPQYDPSTNTIAYTFNVTDPLQIPIEFDNLKAGMVSHDDGMFLGNITIDKPIELNPGQTANITAYGVLSDSAVNYLKTKAQTQSSINVDFVNMNVNVAGIQIQLDKQNVGDIPLSPNMFG